MKSTPGTKKSTYPLAADSNLALETTVQKGAGYSERLCLRVVRGQAAWPGQFQPRQIVK